MDKGALEARNAPLVELHEEVWAFLRNINVHDEGKAAVAAWQRVREKLCTDPDVPLPT